jgi:hypothetical protein
LRVHYLDSAGIIFFAPAVAALALSIISLWWAPGGKRRRGHPGRWQWSLPAAFSQAPALMTLGPAAK